MEATLPGKTYYKIGEVSRVTSLKPSVLRFWETEFKELHPPKSRTGQRLYTSHDIELLLEIKQLLYTERLTIDGARRRLSSMRRGSAIHTDIEGQMREREYRTLIDEIRDELYSLRTTLE